MSKILRQKWWMVAKRLISIRTEVSISVGRARGEAAEEQGVDGRAQPPRAGKRHHDALRRPQPSLPLKVESDA